MISVTHHEKSIGGGGMAKQAADLYTLDLLDKPKRGRPRKPNALTDAERARAYRVRKRAAKDRKARIPVGYYSGPNGETWSGRGLMPRWLVVICKNLECDKSVFLVKAL